MHPALGCILGLLALNAAGPYLGLKRLELSLVSDLELEEVCRLYASVH